MIVKLCPLCDSEMKKAHYCDVCHSFVWKPQTMDIHYNTDTRGLGEVDCAYGEIHDEKDHHMPKTGEWHKQFEKKPSYDKKPLPNRTGEGRKNSSLAKAVVLIIAVITIINALTSLFASLF